MKKSLHRKLVNNLPTGTKIVNIYMFGVGTNCLLGSADLACVIELKERSDGGDLGFSCRSRFV